MMVTPVQLACGVAADLLFGDPRWLPHPIVGVGNLAAFVPSHAGSGHWSLVRRIRSGVRCCLGFHSFVAGAICANLLDLFVAGGAEFG